jgi:hypothetical protein
MVDAVINMMSEAIEYDLGYYGNFVGALEVKSNDEDEDRYAQGKGGFFRFQDDLRKVAYEEEHAVVHVANKYCVVVDRTLKEELGD